MIGNKMLLRNYKSYMLIWEEQLKIEETEEVITLLQLEKKNYRIQMDQHIFF